MRTFKQFMFGDMNYELSFDSFTHVTHYSSCRAYLRIVRTEDESSFYVRVYETKHWTWNMTNGFHRGITDPNKSQEVRRLIMLFLTNSL